MREMPIKNLASFLDEIHILDRLCSRTAAKTSCSSRPAVLDCSNAQITDNAKSVLAEAILHIYSERHSVPTLFDVSEFFLSSRRVAVIDKSAVDGQTAYEVHRLIAQVLAPYRDPRVRKNTMHSDFSIRDLLDPKRRISLYATVECEEYSMNWQLERLLVSMIQYVIASTVGTSAADNPHILLMLDDFIQLGYLPYCESSLLHGSSHGVQACLVAQDVSQLNKIYTKDNSIMGNCHVQIYFTPTNNESMMLLSKKLGMTPDEVSRMSQEKELVFVGGHRPIYGDKIRFYLEPYFKKRVQAPPPFSDTCVEQPTA